MNEEQMKKKFLNDLKIGNNAFDRYVNNMGKLDVGLAQDIACEECGCNRFTMFNYLKRIPEISSPSGKPVIIPIQAFSCSECDHVNKDFLLQQGA
tara:strand:+ start:390 stop:674 length:285 start_codon:yes stop_codon:yes gene_type:complete